MGGRSQKTTEPNTPRESLNTSLIQEYLKDASVKSPAPEKKQLGAKEKKKELAKNKGVQGGKYREELEPEGEFNLSMAEGRDMDSIPTKTDMLAMFAKLENLIKTEILNIRTDMGHLLKQVEIAEEVTEKQSQEILVLKTLISKLQKDQREVLYKLEEQENQSHWQNLRIRALPEQQGEHLPTKMKKFNAGQRN